MLWTEDEEAMVRRYYPEHGAHWEGWETLLPNRTPDAIMGRAYSMGVRVSGEFTLRGHNSRDSLRDVDERAAAAVAALGEWEMTRLRILVEVASGRRRNGNNRKAR